MRPGRRDRPGRGSVTQAAGEAGGTSVPVEGSGTTIEAAGLGHVMGGTGLAIGAGLMGGSDAAGTARDGIGRADMTGPPDGIGVVEVGQGPADGAGCIDAGAMLGRPDASWARTRAGPPRRLATRRPRAAIERRDIEHLMCGRSGGPGTPWTPGRFVRGRPCATRAAPASQRELRPPSSRRVPATGGPACGSAVTVASPVRSRYACP